MVLLPATSTSKEMELTTDFLEELREEFYSDDKNRFAQNVISKTEPNEACFERSVYETTNNVFSHKLSDEAKPVTNQKSSGRCWLFAALNAMRIPFITKLNLDEFEFSQSYLFYCDKIERSYYFLDSIIKVAKREPKEEIDGRLMTFLLSGPVSDGGQWDMFANLIDKYGVMPKKCFPETYSCESSGKMNGILKTKLREYARKLRSLVDKGASDEDLAKELGDQMRVIHRIVGICLSIPPKTFVWEYYDKSKAYKKIGPITPVEFYQTHVKPVFDVSQKVCLVSDPREENPINRTYTVDCLGNVVGGRPLVYNNQPIDILIDVAAKSIKAGVPVWFGCDVSKQFSSRKGIMDLKAYDHELVFGTEVLLGLEKADRLRYGVSCMSHAMILTGVHIDQNDKPVKWRIENSWGKDTHEDGYITMTTDWFREFAFEIVTDKEFVPKEILDVFKAEPIVLPAWDPMGILA